MHHVLENLLFNSKRYVAYYPMLMYFNVTLSHAEPNLRFHSIDLCKIFCANQSIEPCPLQTDLVHLEVPGNGQRSSTLPSWTGFTFFLLEGLHRSLEWKLHYGNSTRVCVNDIGMQSRFHKSIQICCIKIIPFSDDDALFRNIWYISSVQVLLN